MPRIEKIKARPILDSRGEWTIEASLFMTSGDFVTASVPQGKSKGENEAVSLNPNEAVKIIEDKISPALLGVDVENQNAIDEKMISLDGTQNKSKLGGNSILAVSIAVARGASLHKKIPLWKHISDLSKMDAKLPRLFVNVINGGLHAGNGLAFQEYIVIPKDTSVFSAIDTSVSLYKHLSSLVLSKCGAGSNNIGDEGGFAPSLKDNLEPFEFIHGAAKDAGLLSKIDVGIDCAATNSGLQNSALFEIYEKMIKEWRPIYIEDPFQERDEDNFKKFTGLHGQNILVAGDDLSVTDPKRISALAKEGAMSAVIIKPNQIGSVSEAIEAVRVARENKIAVVVSHRSGETNDDFISDFAVGIGADGFKLGAPARGERLAKYNRLLAIEKEM